VELEERYTICGDEHPSLYNTTKTKSRLRQRYGRTTSKAKFIAIVESHELNPQSISLDTKET
jgi:hypothetical protein